MNMAQIFEQGLGRKLELPVLQVASYSDQPSQEGGGYSRLSYSACGR